MGEAAWVKPTNAGLLTDLYQLTMVQAYLEEGLTETAVFDLFARRLPEHRNFLLACGAGEVPELLEAVRFGGEEVAYLESTGLFSRALLDYLESFRFEGEVEAIPEGTPVFANEPIVRVSAPLPQAQLVETILLNQVHFQTLIASKAARVVLAARGRTLIDFGLRRMHGMDAGIRAARAAWIAGMDGTSNVLAGRLYAIPTAGTMAHSYVEAHDGEMEAFRAFSRIHPGTTLLVDTYDTLEGVRRVCELARERGEAFDVRAVRLDSGDLGELSKASRRLLDAEGLGGVKIFASGGLDEHVIDDLLRRGAPIDGFGVGTRLGVSGDAPALDSAYKLVEYAGWGRMKLSSEKATLPGRKQVWRVAGADGETASHDVVGLEAEGAAGEPLLRPLVRSGRRVGGREPEPLEVARERARAGIERLEGRLRALDPAEPAYEVRVSDRLREGARALERRIGAGRQGLRAGRQTGGQSHRRGA